MNKMRNALIALVITSLAALWLFKPWVKSQSISPWKKSTLEMGIIENTVSATGTLGAVGTVEIGSQVSGSIAKLLVDFNDHVKKNQALAVLDMTTLIASRDESMASVAKAEAQCIKSKQDLDRALQFFEKKMIPETELQVAQSVHAVNQATLMQAQASLRKASAALTHATIRSPIEGTVISRSVEVGQTVAASLSTPTLFIVAEDLKRMEILANVDESDIGKIKLGQSVRFSVQAHPDSEFTGTVQQIRMQAQVIQNVVNYTVVIEAPNPSLQLLPGMTATVDFIISQSDSGLLAPVTATTFKPDPNFIKAGSADPHDQTKTQGQGNPNRSDLQGNHQSEGANANRKKKRDPSRARLWIERNGILEPVRIKVGASDGSKVLLTEFGTLQAGDSVVVGANASASSKSKNTSLSPMMMRPPR